MNKSQYEAKYLEYKKIYYNSELLNELNNALPLIANDEDLTKTDKNLLTTMYRDYYNYRANYQGRMEEFKGFDLYHAYMKNGNYVDPLFIIQATLLGVKNSREFAKEYLAETEDATMINLLRQYWKDYIISNTMKDYDTLKINCSVAIRGLRDLVDCKIIDKEAHNDLCRQVATEAIAEINAKRKKGYENYTINKLREE